MFYLVKAICSNSSLKKKKKPPGQGKHRCHHHFALKENSVQGNQQIYFYACEVSLSLESTETRD